jgi:hypothetical protein
MKFKIGELTMRHRALIVAAALLTYCGVEATADSAVPDLLGTWTGTFIGGVRLGGGDLAPADATPTFVHEGMNREYTLKIVEQNGRGILGTWSSVKGSEDIQGVIRLDNWTIRLSCSSSDSGKRPGRPSRGFRHQLA